MKKTGMLVIIFVLHGILASAQTIDQVKKDIYYNRLETAKSGIKLMLANENASPDAWYLLGEIYLKQDSVKTAYVTLTQAVKQYPELSKKSSPLLFIGLAHALMDSGLVDQAKTQMDEVLKASKYKDPVALIAAAKVNIESKNGDPALALNFLNLAEKKSKRNAELYLQMGEAYRKLIDGGAAIASYNKALDIGPLFAEPMYRMGLIYKTQENTEVYVDKFSKAYAIDSGYNPAIYELYYYYYFRNVIKADTLLRAYIRHADPDPQHAYMITDLQYVSAKYKEAITGSKSIIDAEGDRAAPRLYKLIAYSYAALKDSTAALENMNIYFEKQDTLSVVARDYELKARLLEKLNPDKQEAIVWYRKALAADSSKQRSINYMVTLADLQKELGNREREAKWREKIYTTKEKPSNLDIYNWGLALYGAANYEKADSVFGIYEDKYPEQIYGYLWRARSNALIDTSMEKGLAVPHYIKLAEVASADSVKNKDILLRAYQYLGAYEATISKNYEVSLEYYEKVLALNPEDEEASKNAKILNKWITEGKGTN